MTQRHAGPCAGPRYPEEEKRRASYLQKAQHAINEKPDTVLSLQTCRG